MKVKDASQPHPVSQRPPPKKQATASPLKKKSPSHDPVSSIELGPSVLDDSDMTQCSRGIITNKSSNADVC